MGELPRHDFADYLYAGWAQTRFMPQQALENLREACSIRPKSQVAKMFYATALWYDAIQLANPHEGLEQANEAIRILGAVPEFLPDHPRVLAELVLAHICASVHYEAIGDGEQSRACLRDVTSTVDRLADWPKSIDAKWARAMYFYQTGQEKAILDHFREVRKARAGHQDV